MNKERRKAIKKSVIEIERVVQTILDEEQEAYDNMPDSVQDSNNGMNSLEAQESLEAAIDALEEAIVCLEEIY